MQVSQLRSGAEVVLNVESAGVFGADLVLASPGFPVFLLYVTVLPQNVEAWNDCILMLTESMGQKFRQDTMERVVSGPQTWSFPWKDSKAGGWWGHLTFGGGVT